MKRKFAVHWQYGVTSHPGWHRVVNEDCPLMRIGVTEHGEPYAVLMIADGLGGLGDGQKASEFVHDEIIDWLDKHLSAVLKHTSFWQELDREIQALFTSMHEQLVELSNLHNKKYATTLSFLFLMKGTYYVCHIGDCRIYKVNKRRQLQQLTRDHTWIAQQVRLGNITSSDARKHPDRHILLQCLGAQHSPRIFTRFGFYNTTDCFFLCSDGYYDVIPDLGTEKFIRESEGKIAEFQEITEFLMDKALDRQSIHNMTIMLIQPVKQPFEESEWDKWMHRFHHAKLVFPELWKGK